MPLDAVKLAFGKLQSMDIVVAVQDFDFLGGSLGMAAGEAIITGMTAAIERHTPFIIFTASGGARMQEGIFSLMQMPRTTIAVQRLRDAKLPYIVVLTNPTTGGVTASYAMLGDIHIAEPGAVIGFAGATGDRTNDTRTPARRLSARRISRGAWHDRHGGETAGHARNARPPLRTFDPDPAHRASGRLRLANKGNMDSLDALLSRLFTLHRKTIELSLGRIERLLAALGSPE